MRPFIFLALALAACQTTHRPSPSTSEAASKLDSAGRYAVEAEAHRGNVGRKLESARTKAQRIDDKAVVVLKHL